MDFNTTIDLIIKDLKEASEIIDDLKKYPGVPAIQVELAKSKCRSAADVIALLKTIHEPGSHHVEPVAEEDFFQTLSETEVFSEELKDENVPEEQIIESKAEEMNVISSEKKQRQPDIEKKTEETTIVADKFVSTTDLYEEQSSKLKVEKDLSDKLTGKPLVSISEAIGISDKFLFMGEIFNGNKELYAQAISRLDKAEKLQDAMSIIMSYTGEKSESDAVRQLLELVKLKLQADE